MGQMGYARRPVTGILYVMPDTPPLDRLHELGNLVREIRHGRQMSIRAAAEAAGLSKITWQKVESGVRVTDSSRVRIERALHWVPGSISRFLATGELPAELVHQPSVGGQLGRRRATGEDAPSTTELIEMIIAAGLPLHEQNRLIANLLDDLTQRGQQVVGGEGEAQPGPTSQPA